MFKGIYTILFLLGLLFASSVYAEKNWSSTKKSVKSGSNNIALASKTVWHDTKKISVTLWQDTKEFSADLWGRTKQSVHSITAPSKTRN